MLNIRKIYVLCLVCVVMMSCSASFHVKKQLLVCPNIATPAVPQDSLAQLFSTNKRFHPKIKSAALVALSRYPELKNVKIEFLFSKAKATMETRPKINLNVLGRKHRTYQVFINNNQGKHKALDIDSLTETVKIGWIAHELGHIVDYESRSALSLFFMAPYYVFVPSFKQNIEQSVDIITIRHGFGYEHCEGVEYLLYQSNATEAYKKRNLKYYLPIERMNKEICKCQ